MSHFLVTIPAPGPFLRINQRDHFHQRARLTRTWREAAAWEARRQHLPKFGTGPVHITGTFHWADNRRRDLDGFVMTLKAAIDGIQDAGCLDEDHAGIVPELTIRKGEQWADAALVVTITRLENAA